MNIKLLTAAVLAFGVSFGAQASLTSSGDLTVFDSGQNLTWTKDANLSGTTMNWATAVAWANNLEYDGHTDWVLPTITQLTNQFSNNLGEPLGKSITAIDGHNANYALFDNVQSYRYWSSGSASFLASGFSTSNGFPDDYSQFSQFYAWAVRPGDVAAAPAAVPLPGAVWLFGSAMVGLMGLKRRKNIA